MLFRSEQRLGDDTDAKALLAGVITAAGLKALDAGPLTRARELEAFGFLQITLCWPVGAGAAGLDARAQMIRTAFPQGRSFTTGKVTTVIAATMEKMPGQVADAHFESAVRIPFFSNVLP